MSKATEQRRLEALAHETASWQSWSVQQWFTNGHMAVMLDEPFTGPAMELEYECSCDDNGRLDHLHTLERLCVFRDVYQRDTEITARLTKFLTKVLENPAGIPLTIEPEAVRRSDVTGVRFYRARVGSDPHPSAWVAINVLYVEAIRKHGRPDAWYVMGLSSGPVGTRYSASEAPWVVAVRGDRGVGVVMPMAHPESMIGIDIETPEYTGVAP